MARLIVNADDLGYTAGIGRSILALHAAGALSSATAMAKGRALCEFPWPSGLGVGCHLVLVDGQPSATVNEVPSLLADGVFRPTLARFAVDLLLRRIHERDIEREAVAQIRMLQARGLQLTHIDTHKHTHMFPAVLRPLLRAAHACGVRAVRNPFEPAWARAARTRAPRLRRFQLELLARYREGFLREVDRAGMRTTSGALGVLATGVLDAAALDQLLGTLERFGEPGETYELVCHPGFHDAALDRERTRLRAERTVEHAAMLDRIPRWTAPGAPHRLVSFAAL